MVLEYKFNYISNNKNYISLLNNIIRNSDLNYKISKENNFIFLYIESKEEQLLEISEQLSKKLSMSIFLKNFTLEVVPKMPQKEDAKTLEPINLSYCSDCISKVKNEYLNSFNISLFTCDICDTIYDLSNLKVFKKEEVKYENIKALLKDIALKIKNNKKIRIKTEYYDFVFYKMQKLNLNNQKVLCTDLEFLSKLAVSSQEKRIALATFEKPTILFNINEIFKRNNNLNFEKVYITLAKDIVTYLLSIELKALNIEFLIYEKLDSYDYELSYDFDKEKHFALEVSIHNDKLFILKNSLYDNKLDKIYNKFKNRAKSQFMVLLEENKAYDKTILNLFCSTRYDEQITLYSEQIDGMIDILNYKVPVSINEILNDISKNETGKRVLKNYKNKFPKNFESCLNHKELVLESNSINSLWKIVSIVLGFEDSILENAKKALLQKGPRVDYKLKDSVKVYNREFHISKLIQSGISFKLAGVDDKSLCLGYVESYAYFLANIIDDVNKEFPLEGVSICGDMIADEFFYKILNKAITNNFKLFYNKDFPIQL